MALDADRIQEPAKKIRKLLKKMPAQPTPDEIHKFRTNARRIETSMEVLSFDSKRAGRKVSKRIAKLRKRAGKIRDMDVLIGYVSALDFPDSENECSVQLLEYLGAQRKEQVKKFQVVRRNSSSQLLRRIRRTWKKMKAAVEKGATANGQTPSGKAAASALALLSALKQPARLNKTNLHPYRLKVKELRNILQAAANVSDENFIDTLGDVKDAIGEWHDWQVLVTIAKDVLDHRRGCRLGEQLRRTAENKFQEALMKAQNMRRHYLRVSTTGKKRPGADLSQSALSATAALAA